MTAFFTSVVAVLAAVGTLLATHRSIIALATQTQGLHYAQQASDQYAYYQTQQVKASMYRVMLAAVPVDAARSKQLQTSAQQQERNSLAVLAHAKELETQAEHAEERSDYLLEAFERLEIATTFFEIAIAVASIGVLTQVRAALFASAILAVIGVVVGVIGYLTLH